MNTSARLPAAIALVFAWVATPTPVLACSCVPERLCQAFASYPASESVFFEGTVTSIERVPAKQRFVDGKWIVDQYAKKAVHLTDVRALLGEAPRTVYTSDGTSCDI